MTSYQKINDVRVTARTPLTVKMGRDDAPVSSLTRVATSINNSPINRAGWSAMTAWTIDADTGFTTSAPVNPAPKDNDVMTGREQEGDDAAAGFYRQRDGQIVRTVAMGDAPLPRPGAVRHERALAGLAGAPASLADKRADTIAARNQPSGKAQRDAAVAAYLAGKGYTGPITRQIRDLALDALTFADQVDAMAS